MRAWLVLLLLTGLAWGQEAFFLEQPDGTIVALGAVDKPRSPFSTFKVPHSVIALDCQAVASTREVIEWDPTTIPRADYWPEDWLKPHTLESALRSSALPFFQAVALRVGSARMQDYLSRFDYGNADISSGQTTFWLDGSLKISPRQQVRFLKRLYFGHLPAAPEAQRVVRRLLSEMEGKTGSGPEGDHFLGWRIGRTADGSFYALLTEAPNYTMVKERRQRRLQALLKRFQDH